ncbi:MAG: hypothetical protein ACOZAA_02525 [Pseudomonadota bacterium]
MKKAACVLAGVLAAASVASAEKEETDALDRFDRTGETVNCVEMRSTDISAIDEDTLLFRVGPGDYYVNETRGTCNDADSAFSRFDITLYGSRICSGEIIRIVDRSSGIFQGACSLGEFEKLTKKPVSDEPAK